MRQNDATPSYGIEAVARALRLLELFSAAQPDLDLMTISRQAALPKSTTFRYLTTLQELGYIEHDARASTYHLGLKLFQLGQVAVDRLDIRAVARPSMKELAKHHQETINLGVLNGQHVVLIEVVESPRSVRKGATLGDRDALHSTAIGKAILAYQAPEAIEALVKLDALPRLTPQTKTDPKALGRELERTRQRGYSLDQEEGEVGLCCVGAPIFDHRGEVRYALSLSAPSGRLPLTLAHEIGTELVKHSARIAAALGALPTALPATHRQWNSEEETPRRLTSTGERALGANVEIRHMEGAEDASSPR